MEFLFGPLSYKDSQCEHVSANRHKKSPVVSKSVNHKQYNSQIGHVKVHSGQQIVSSVLHLLLGGGR